MVGEMLHAREELLDLVQHRGFNFVALGPVLLEVTRPGQRLQANDGSLVQNYEINTSIVLNLIRNSDVTGR